MQLLRPTRVVLLAGILAHATSTLPVGAQSADDAATEMARERFQEGVRFYDLKEYEKARAAFLQAYALKQHPAVLLNLAQSELRSGHEADAATHFARYLRTNPDPQSPERAEAERGLAAAKEKVAEVHVTTPDSGYRILVDGEEQGVSPLEGPLYLAPGSHQLEAIKQGAPIRRELIAEPGQSTTVDFTPSARKAPAPTVADEPDPLMETEATFDDRSSQSFFSWFAETPGAWVGAGVTALGLAGGIGFALTSKNRYDRADDIAGRIREAARTGDPPTQNPGAPCANLAPGDPYTTACQRYLDRVDEGDRFKTLSIAGFVVAGVGAAGTIVYYLIDGGGSTEQARPGERRNTAIVPVIGARFAGMSVSGEF